MRGIFDCNYLLGYEMGAGLADWELFRQVRAEHGTLCWPDGTDDAPETVWEAPEKSHIGGLLPV